MSTLFSKKIQQINCFSSSLEQKSFDELLEFRDKCFRKSVCVTEIEWFALVREMSTRVLTLRHFETQLLSGLLLNEGKIVEMKTGEGKTLASTLPLSYKALAGKGAHLITLNSYLADRDYKVLKKLYNF